jgi:Ca-activated chloride channel family protein
MATGTSNTTNLRREWRALLRLFLESCAAGLVASIVLGLAVFIVATQAKASTTGDIQQGSLLLDDGHGTKIEAPLIFTKVEMDVSGMTARVAVEQRFVNPGDDWREGVYVFPLPECAAVDHLDMQIGERVIEGQIKERISARRTYDQAKTEGRKAALVEQERPNLFTTSVAHIGPNEEIVVAIEYQERLAYDNGTFHLRFPLAITPRYIPTAATTSNEAIAVDTNGTTSDAIIDADRITPPVVHPSQGAVNPVSIEVRLAAGFPLAKISSTYHAVHIDELPDNRYRLTLSPDAVPASRDFELTWSPDVGRAPGAALFTETRGGERYAFLMVLPPSTADLKTTRAPREITYIVDTSGSMEGVSIEQAREALLLALDRLREGDRFNVIEFNSVTKVLWSAPMPVDSAALAAARSFVKSLRAGGGTEMRPALEAALSTPRVDALIRQVVFLTDGAVGNESELLALIERKLGDRRLFTVGIGPAPNAYFMKKAAEAGRGTYTFIGDVREVKDKMSALIRKLEHPVLRDVAIQWPGAAETYPARLPDLYAGEPVMLSARLAPSVAGKVALRGAKDGSDWSAQLPIMPDAEQPGIGVLWARDKIEALMDAKRNGASEDDVRRDVIDVALTHHLVSAYTSLVAVDVTPTAPAGMKSVKTAMPGNLPEGLSFEAIYGLPQTATPAPLYLALGSGLLVAALVLFAFSRRPARVEGRVTRVATPARGATEAPRDDPVDALFALVRASRRVC